MCWRAVKNGPPGRWSTPARKRGQLCTAGRGRADLTLRDDGSALQIQIRGRRVRPNLFSRFPPRATSTTRRGRRVCLGLALVKELVELHGGQTTRRERRSGTGAASSRCRHYRNRAPARRRCPRSRSWSPTSPATWSRWRRYPLASIVRATSGAGAGDGRDARVCGRDPRRDDARDDGFEAQLHPPPGRGRSLPIILLVAYEVAADPRRLCQWGGGLHLSPSIRHPALEGRGLRRALCIARNCIDRNATRGARGRAQAHGPACDEFWRHCRTSCAIRWRRQGPPPSTLAVTASWPTWRCARGFTG